jgi:hypothetical protein
MIVLEGVEREVEDDEGGCNDEEGEAEEEEEDKDEEEEEEEENEEEEEVGGEVLGSLVGGESADCVKLRLVDAIVPFACNSL